VEDVAADRDREPFEALLRAADGERVEQRLGRVRVLSVAGVDDAESAAPEWWWRMTTTSGCIASSVSTVSLSDSPLLTLELDAVMFTTSAERRLPASSNDVRVRVEAS
jgi:hypothetical protein